MMIEKKRILLAETKSGNLRKIEIPDDWVISFGPVAVGAKYQTASGEHTANVLRIYTDKKRTDLMGVYRDIISVSDQRINVTEKKVIKKQKLFQKIGSNGEKNYAAEIRKTVWQNPFADEPGVGDEEDFGEDILKLPAGLDDD